MMAGITLRTMVLAAALLALSGPAQAHHILGRPAYNYSGDASSPPSISLEVQIGKYSATMMAFPLELHAKEPVRVKLYATRLDNGERFQGTVQFSVRDDGWLHSQEEILGDQTIDPNGIYAQEIVFSRDGNYIVTAKFESDGEPYVIDFPLQVGKPLPIGLLASMGTVVAIALGAVSVAKKKQRAKVPARA